MADGAPTILELKGVSKEFALQGQPIAALRFFRNEYEVLLQADPHGPQGNGAVKS